MAGIEVIVKFNEVKISDGGNKTFYILSMAMIFIGMQLENHLFSFLFVFLVRNW